MTYTLQFGILLIAASAAPGQTAFEVASVKPAAPTTGHFQYHMTMKTDAGRVEIANASLIDLVRTGYGVKSDQISGPDWMPTEKFDVVAKLPEGAAPDEIPKMLQTLLATRFKLAMHRSSGEHAGLAIVAAKSGPKLKESEPDPDGSRSGWTRTAQPDGSLHVDTRKMTMTALADLLATFLDCPVRDMTAIPGAYDMPLDFSPEDLRTSSRVLGLAADAAPETSGSAIYGSLQKLGLRLEKRKFQVEVIVIDRLEKVPTGN